METNPQPQAGIFGGIASLVSSAFGGITSLIGKNADIKKAQTELETAQQSVLIAREATKQSGNAVTIAAYDLAKTKEATAQKALNDATAITKQKQSIGVITLAVVLLLIFGLAFLFVKFVLPILFPKPEAQAQNVVIQDN